MLATAIRVLKEAASELLGEADSKSVTVTLVGIPGVGASDDDESGERYEGVDVWGPVGIVSRGKDPEGDDFVERLAGVRPHSDDAVAIGARDKRISRVFPNPKKGTTATVGYSGAYVSVDPSTTTSGSMVLDIVTLYVPYAFSGSVPAKALVVTLDPTTESILMLHGDGYAVGLTADDGIKMRASGTSFLTFKKGGDGNGVFTLAAAKINLRGNVALGADTTTAVPLLPGAASQPTPSVFFSPV